MSKHGPIIFFHFEVQLKFTIYTLYLNLLRIFPALYLHQNQWINSYLVINYITSYPKRCTGSHLMVNVGKPKNISSFLTSNWIRDLTDLGAFSSYMQCMYYHKKTCTLNMLWLFFVFPELVRIVINLLLTILHSLCISIISASKYFCFLYNDHIKQNKNTTQLSQA